MPTKHHSRILQNNENRSDNHHRARREKWVAARKLSKLSTVAFFICFSYCKNERKFLQHWTIFLHKRILFMSSLPFLTRGCNKKLWYILETSCQSETEWRECLIKFYSPWRRLICYSIPLDKKERVFQEIPSWCVVNESQDVDTSTREYPRMQWRKSIK